MYAILYLLFHAHGYATLHSRSMVLIILSQAYKHSFFYYNGTTRSMNIIYLTKGLVRNANRKLLKIKKKIFCKGLN